jgi:transcriptional regulator with XRE-family HTH domain
MTEEAMTSSVHREFVAAELKRIREGLGVPGEEVAAALGWSQPKVSRIENARISVSVKDLATLLQYYDVPEEVQAELLAVTAEDEDSAGAWIVRAGGPRRRQGEVAAIESRLDSIRQYYPLVIPGHLQSREYALAHARIGGWPEPDSIVERRLQRQRLLESTSGPSYEALLDARAFLAWPAGRDVMLEQFDYIRSRAAIDNISVRIIPVDAVRTAVSMVPFTLYKFRTGSSPTVVFIESQTADLYMSDTADVKEYETLFARLAADALDTRNSLDYLAVLAEYVDNAGTSLNVLRRLAGES